MLSLISCSTKVGNFERKVFKNLTVFPYFLEKDGKANIPALYTNGRSDQELYGIVIQKNSVGEEIDK